MTDNEYLYKKEQQVRKEKWELLVWDDEDLVVLEQNRVFPERPVGLNQIDLTIQEAEEIVLVLAKRLGIVVATDELGKPIRVNPK